MVRDTLRVPMYIGDEPRRLLHTLLINMCNLPEVSHAPWTGISCRLFHILYPEEA